jgi:hypothetical protein
MTGRTDGFVWPVAVNEQKTKSDVITGNKLVWMGGVESHKKKSMQWFIESVFPVIKSEIPDVEFHIWGNRTKQFDNPSCGVFGYGFYNGNDFPFKISALYVNPDIIGGGVKVKLATYFENGLKFISTPFGFEGYNKNLVDNKSCYVVDTNDFADAIIHILKRNFWLKR